MEKTSLPRIKIIFIVGTILLLTLSVFSYVRINNLIYSSTVVNHTNVVKLQLESLFASLNGLESAQRGYLLTKNKAFLNQFNAKLHDVNRRVKSIKTLTGGNYSQRRNIESLVMLLDKRVNYMTRVMKDGEKASIPTDRLLGGKIIMDELREHLDKMMDEEDFLLRLSTESLTKETALTPLFTIMLMICSILVLLLAYYGINRELRISNQFKADLETRKKELLEANTSLQKSNQEIALSKYNKRFLVEFSERFSNYKVHNEFFNSLVQYISDITHLDYVMVGKLDNSQDNHVIKTTAITAFGKLTENISFPLDIESLEKDNLHEAFCHPENCRKLFPNNYILKKLEVNGCVGYPLYNSDEMLIGQIAVMHKKNIEDPETISSILKIVAKRTEMELERIKNEELLAHNNASLLEINKSLEKMNKELESFTYISSHDLQEPLRKIQTFITRIIDKESDNLSESGRNYLKRTSESANRMQTLIRDLLAYSRLNAEIFPIETTDLNLIVDEIRGDLEEDIIEKSVIIDVIGKHKVNIIVSQFRQLLINLISNSIKFSVAQTAPHIIIRNTVVDGKDLHFEGIPAQQKYSCITISDNGIGFDSQYKSRIFEVFQRLHVDQQFVGTGIGLAIVKKIVENHHGYITADGETGKGAVFTIYIPA